MVEFARYLYLVRIERVGLPPLVDNVVRMLVRNWFAFCVLCPCADACVLPAQDGHQGDVYSLPQVAVVSSSEASAQSIREAS